MQYKIKRLKQGSDTIAPQTVAEAVLVKQGTIVYTLDNVINRKVETIKSSPTSGITVSRTGNTVDISHTNQITPNEAIQPLQVQYDNTGHIVNTAPLGKLKVTASAEQVLEANWAQNQELNFGDDFQKDSYNNIVIRWNNYGNT